MKNASVTIGTNQKNKKFTGNVINGDGTRTERDKKDVFTVNLGTEYLQYGKDFTISYSNNQAVGKALMTITGIGDYIGTKNYLQYKRYGF